MYYGLLFWLFALFAQANREAGIEVLQRNLPVFVKINDFPDKGELELLVKAKLVQKNFRSITKEDLDALVIAEGRRVGQMLSPRINAKTDMTVFMKEMANYLSPVAQVLSITVVPGNQEHADSCYFVMAKTPYASKKGYRLPRHYLANSTIKKGDFSLLSSEIITLSTGTQR